MAARKRTKYIHEGGRYVESLDGPPDADVEEAWRLEIERRMGQIERGEVQLIPGDEVIARLRRRLG